MAEGSGTASSLAWEVLRLLEVAGEREKPEWLLMENVITVFTAAEWPEILRRLEAMGYHNKWKKLDSSRFGSAQQRVRAFMVSRLGQDPPELPSSNPNAPSLCLRDVMETSREEKYIRRIPIKDVCWREQPEGKTMADWIRDGREQSNRLYSPSCASPTIIGHGGGGRDIKVVADDISISFEHKARIYAKDGKMPTLIDIGRRGRGYFKIMDQCDNESLTVDILTPREYWRLMGFPEWAYLRASRVSSETQLYNQAGNSIVVEVLMAIFNAMFRPQKYRVQTRITEATA